MGTLKGKTLLSGHALVMEGDAYAIVKGRKERLRHNGDGFALCTCGQFSYSLPSRAARKRWHREHKMEVKIYLDAS